MFDFRVTVVIDENSLDLTYFTEKLELPMIAFLL